MASWACENDRRPFVRDKIRAVLLGVALGDALGVPVEFQRRETMRKNPVTGMRGFGAHNVPAGTYSDDTALTLCLADNLAAGFDPGRLAQSFLQWWDEDFWAACSPAFGLGQRTMKAFARLEQGVAPEQAGGRLESDNGNGSLMRIAPLMFFLLDKPFAERLDITRQVSSITHAHVRSVVACFYHLEFARLLYFGWDKSDALRELRQLGDYLVFDPPEEKAHFARLWQGEIAALPDTEIRSGGYVIDTLEASLWCLLTTNSFADALLAAVNLGHDTDTTAAVTGALAGLLYGEAAMPEAWLQTLARRADIETLADRMATRLTRGK
jgi:ADP-ribosylglycohydrolase